MNINLTLVVQIINFLIAYFIITKFFLKPVLAFIKDDNAVNQSLLLNIAKEDQKLLQKSNIKKNNWLKLQNYFFKNKPNTNQDIKLLNHKFSEIKKYESLDKKQLDELVNNISKELESKVIHD